MSSEKTLRRHVYAIAKDLGVDPETNPVLSIHVECDWITMRYIDDEGKVVRFKTEYPTPVTGMQP